MSDGPYKSLKMRKPWKAVTELAHKGSYTSEECSAAMREAVHDDFKRDIPKDMMKAIGRAVLDSEAGTLLPTFAQAELETVRHQYQSSALGDAVIEHTQVALQMGKTGSAALEEGFTRAGIDYARSNILGVEEHYRREPKQFQDERKTISVRQRLSETLQTVTVRAVGREVVAMLAGAKINTKMRKEVGLEAGPMAVL